MNEVYEFGPFLFDPGEHLLLRDSVPVALSPKVFEILLVLVRQSGHLVTKDELMSAVWPDSFVEESNLSVNISALRKALGEVADGQQYIETVPKRGYRFRAPVRQLPGRIRAPQQPSPFAMPESTSSGRIPDPALRERGGFTVLAGGASAVRESPLPVDDEGTGNAEPEGEPAAAGAAGVLPTLVAQSRPWRRWAIVTAVLLVLGLAYLFRPPLPTPQIVLITQITNSGQVDGASDQATDGPRLYYEESSNGHWTLNELAVAGGTPVPVPNPFREFHFWSIRPGSGELLLTSTPDPATEGELWSLPVPGGSPRRVGAVTGQAASWSADGKQLAFARGLDLFVAGGDGSGRRKLATASGRIWWLAWSPDSSLIRFTVDGPEGNTHSLWEVRSEGSGLRPLWPGSSPSSTCCGKWSPDGKYYAFERVIGNRGSIWTVREKADWLHKTDVQPVQLTSGPLDATDPVWSHDGTRLFVVGGQNRGELQKYDSKSAGFGAYLGGVAAHRLSFSRDGQWIAFVGYPDSVLWRIRADGTGKQQLTFGDVRADVPVWSPDGSQIAFVARLKGKPDVIEVIPSAGGNPRPLLTESVSQANPDWSPDGASLVFGRPAEEPSGPQAIQIFGLKTDHAIHLAGSDGFIWPRWSPDGKRLAALSANSDKLMVLDFGSGQWRPLASGTVLHNPIWSHDGRYIYYQDLVGMGQPIYRVAMSNGKPETIATAAQLHRTDVVYNAFTGLTPDNEPLTLMIQALHDIYALDLKLP
jgi:DNA-binding winged helix-turn-helix (wHTH) protein/Tol biopolymer transport system component